MELVIDRGLFDSLLTLSLDRLQDYDDDAYIRGFRTGYVEALKRIQLLMDTE